MVVVGGGLGKLGTKVQEPILFVCTTGGSPARSLYATPLDAYVHDTARHLHLMQIADAEQEAVLNWVPHEAKKKNKAIHLRGPMMPHLRQRPRVHPATSLHRLQACFPSLCLALSLLPPPAPSESETTTFGAERSRPLKSVGKHNKKRRDSLKRARRNSSSSSSSSEGELFKHL